MFGEDNVEVKLVGDTFDDCAVAAKKYNAENGMTFIPAVRRYPDHRRTGNSGHRDPGRPG
jgi:threonine dehydratase